MALVGACVLVDPRAEAAFDAPKRLIVLLGGAAAALALLAFPGEARDVRSVWRTATTAQRLALSLAAAALVLALVSAVLSPRWPASLDAARTLGLWALLLPLGASRALAGRRALGLAVAFAGTSALNAAVSLLQFSGSLRLFQVTVIGGRRDVSAFVGNDGLLALSLALSGLVCLAAALSARAPALRLAAAGGLVLQLGALAVNQSLTALTALGAGAVVLLTPSLRRRRAWLVLALGGALVSGAMLHPAVSGRVQRVVAQARAGEWDPLLSFRGGPWAAALEMTRARPLVGWGPGTFAAEFVPHRLLAELRYHRRFVNPFLAGAYAEAHSEPLQAAAECGIPAALAALTAAGAVLVGLARARRRAPDAAVRREAVALLVLLGAGGIAALTWFPFQNPITAAPLLLAAGRAWRVAGLSAQDAA